MKHKGNPTARRRATALKAQNKRAAQGGGGLTSEQRQARVDAIVAFWAGGNGATLEEIGTHLNITRERVRQLLRNAGVPSVTGRTGQRRKVTRHPERIVALVRDPLVRSMTMLAGRTKSNVEDLARMLAALGLFDAAVRLFEWREKRYLREKLHARAMKVLDGYTRLAAELGRTPSARDVNAFGTAYHCNLQQVQSTFIGLRDIQRVAGLPHLLRGDQAHKHPRRLRTHCQRGHEYTVKNTAAVFRNGKLVARRCRACNNSAERRSRKRRQRESSKVL